MSFFFKIPGVPCCSLCGKLICKTRPSLYFPFFSANTLCDNLRACSHQTALPHAFSFWVQLILATNSTSRAVARACLGSASGCTVSSFLRGHCLWWAILRGRGILPGWQRWELG